MKLFSSETKFAEFSDIPIHLKDYRKIRLNCFKRSSIKTSIESQKLKLNLEKKLLEFVQKSKTEKKLQVALLSSLRVARYLLQILFTKKIELYKFQANNKQVQKDLGTFNYGAQNTKFYNFYPEPESLVLDKVWWKLTLKQRINLFKKLLSLQHTSFYHDLQGLILWSSYNGVTFKRFIVVEAADYVTRVLLDIMHSHGSEVIIIHYVPYLGYASPNGFLNLVNNQKNYEAHKLLNNEVKKMDFPSPVTILGARQNEKKYISFFSTAPHVTMTKKTIIQENEMVMGAVQNLGIPLKLSLHPQFRKNAGLLSLRKNCEFRNYDSSLEAFLSASEVVISQWSSVVVQAAALGKKVILLDFQDYKLIDLISEDLENRINVAYNTDQLKALLLLALSDNICGKKNNSLAPLPPPLNLMRI